MSKLKVATRLGIGFALVSLLLAVITLLGLSRMSELKSRMDEITKINDVQAAQASTMYLTITERALALRNLILLGENQEELQIEVKRIKAQAEKYAVAEEKLGKLLNSPTSNSTQEEKQLFEAIRKSSVASLPYIAKGAELALAGSREEAYKLLRFEFRPTQKKWWEQLNQLIELEAKQNAEANAQAEVSYANARTMMLFFGALALACSVTAAVVITRSLQRELGGEPAYARAIAEQIAAGDLGIDIEIRQHDNASLLASMKKMRDSLADIVGRIDLSSHTIATASNQIASGNMDLSSRTEQQAGSLEETAAAMEQLTGTVKQNSDNAHQANTLALSASEVAVKGGTVVSQVVGTMGSINESARKIVDIIGVIDGIAFQTNILALNAAVEAARAGEQGRGFAVVATEVRNLAQRSAAAAKEIKTLIGDSVDKVEAGTRLVDQAGATMREIVDSVRHVTDIMGEITSASQEQTAGIEQVNQAIAQMDQATQQNAALVEEATASAASMQEQADGLVQVVGLFKLQPNHAGARALPLAASRAVPVERHKVLPPSATPLAAARPAPSAQQLHVAATGHEEWEEF
jgi:methyl-accepting chemotaxis protein